MNFDELKHLLEEDSSKAIKLPSQLTDLKSTVLPMDKIRKNMRVEIGAQFITFLLFLLLPSVLPMTPIAANLFYALIGLTAAITLIYLYRMGKFLSAQPAMTQNSLLSLTRFVHELQLTLSVYRTAVIASSLLLIFILPLVLTGFYPVTEQQLIAVLRLQIPTSWLVIALVYFVVSAVLCFLVTDWWIKKLYGNYLSDLQQTLQAMQED